MEFLYTKCIIYKNQWKSFIITLQAFIYVSTTYSFCAGRKVIEEKIYDPPIPVSNLITVMEQLDDTVVNKISPQYVHCNPY